MIDSVVGLVEEHVDSGGLTEIIDCFKKEEEEDNKEGNAEVRKRALEHGSDSLFRALKATINYIAQDRADLVFASNCVSHCMSEPTPAAWQALKRIGRYLIDARRIVQTVKCGEVSSHVEGYGDRGWAVDTVSRRSTSGRALDFSMETSSRHGQFDRRQSHLVVQRQNSMPRQSARR